GCCRVARVAHARIRGCAAGTARVCGSARCECAMELAVLRLAARWPGGRRGARALGARCDDPSAVLAAQSRGRRTARAVPRVGVVRVGAELRRLAAEPDAALALEGALDRNRFDAL